MRRSFPALQTNGRVLVGFPLNYGNNEGRKSGISGDIKIYLC